MNYYFVGFLVAIFCFVWLAIRVASLFWVIFCASITNSGKAISVTMNIPSTFTCGLAACVTYMVWYLMSAS